MKRVQQTLKGWADEASSGIHPGRAIMKTRLSFHGLRYRGTGWRSFRAASSKGSSPRRFKAFLNLIVERGEFPI